MNKDYYKILGVSKTSSLDDIKKSFRSLAKEYHPDINKNPEAKFKMQEILEAYEVLSNDAKRKEYDRKGTFDSPNIKNESYNTNYYDFKYNYNWYTVNLFVGDIYINIETLNSFILTEMPPRVKSIRIRKNVPILEIGFERYINLSKIHTQLDIKILNWLLKNDSIFLNHYTICSDFFMPFTGEAYIRNVRQYDTNNKKYSKILKKVNKIKY